MVSGTRRRLDRCQWCDRCRRAASPCKTVIWTAWCHTTHQPGNGSSTDRTAPAEPACRATHPCRAIRKSSVVGDTGIARQEWKNCCRVSPRWRCSRDATLEADSPAHLKKPAPKPFSYFLIWKHGCGWQGIRDHGVWPGEDERVLCVAGLGVHSHPIPRDAEHACLSVFLRWVSGPISRAPENRG